MTPRPSLRSPPRRAAAAPPAAAPPPAAARFGGDFGGGGGPSVPDDEDAMLQHALALSRGEDPAAATHYSNPAAASAAWWPRRSERRCARRGAAQAMAAMGLDLDFACSSARGAASPADPRAGARRRSACPPRLERPPEGDKVLLLPSALEKLMELIPQEHMPQPSSSASQCSAPPAPASTSACSSSLRPGVRRRPAGSCDLGRQRRRRDVRGHGGAAEGLVAKLQPLSSEFARLDVSPKELLERTLAGTYTTLATGDSIAVNYGSMMLELFVLELQEGGGPRPAPRQRRSSSTPTWRSI